MFYCKAQVPGQQISTPPFYVLHHLIEEASGANTWMQTDTIFGMGHSFGQRDYKKSKIFTRIIFQ